MPRTYTDEELVQQHADQGARDALATEEARLSGLRDQLEAARSRRDQAQAAHTEAILKGVDTAPTRDASIAATVDVEGLERAVSRQEADVLRARAALNANARTAAIAAADQRLATLQQDAQRVEADIKARTKALADRFDVLAALRSQEAEAAVERTRLDGTFETDRWAFQRFQRIPDMTRAAKLLDGYLTEATVPMEPNLAAIQDPQAFAAVAQAIAQQQENRS